MAEVFRDTYRLMNRAKTDCPGYSILSLKNANQELNSFRRKSPCLAPHTLITYQATPKVTNARCLLELVHNARCIYSVTKRISYILYDISTTKYNHLT